MITNTKNIDTNSPVTSVVTLDLRRSLTDLGGSQELLCDMALFFKEDVPLMFASLQTAVFSHDSALVERNAHNLKVSAATFRAEPMTTLAARVETLAREGGWIELESLVSPLKSAVAQTIEALVQNKLVAS